MELIPLLLTKSNLKVMTKNMNIIRGVLKNIIDLSAAVRVDIKPNFLTSLPSRVLLSYAGLNKLFLSHCKISKKKKIKHNSTVLWACKGEGHAY